MSARQFVFDLLLKVSRNSSFSNIVLDKELEKCDFSQDDKAFATALFYGVIEKKILLDYQLSIHLKQSIKRLKPEVLTALRIGVYQLFFMDKVPASAAVNESVKLVKKNKCAFASGLVNAVLRNIQKDGLTLPDESSKEYLSVKYSVAQNIIDLWINSYSYDTAIDILNSLSLKRQNAVRVNTILTNVADLKQSLEKEGAEADYNVIDNSLLVSYRGSLVSLDSFQSGLFHIENTAAQIAALSVDAKEGERVLDTCSAPGGKAFTIAQEMKKGEIIACDIYENRLNLINQGAKRLKIDFIKTFLQDASKYNSKLGEFDKILCDVPCSGLGTMSAKPEIRYKSNDDINNSSALQYTILENSYRYLKSGGRIVYSTCTLNPAENEKVVEKFISKYNVKLISSKTFFPHTDNTDGFFIAVIENNE